MYKNKKILCIIPARYGSKQIPLKNLEFLNKRPLFKISIDCALRSKYIDKIIFSSDSKYFLDKIKNTEIIKDLRPKKLSGNKSMIFDTIKYIIKKYDENYDSIILLQPTSPFRKLSDINSSIKKFYSFEQVDNLISVSRVFDNHPARMYKLNKQILTPLDKKQTVSRRQDLPKIYLRNGSIYIFKKENIIQNKFYGQKILHHEMPSLRSINIDNHLDLLIARNIIRNKLFSFEY